jgi:hypothetical protein
MPVGSAFVTQLEQAVERECKRWNVSRSFVIATCVAFALGVDDQADYHKTPKTKVTHTRKGKPQK